jgi:hypothetical protein
MMAKSGGTIDLDAFEAKLESKEWTGPVVKFRGTEYQFADDIAVADLVDLEESGGSSFGFLVDLVIEAQREAFREVLIDRDNPVSSVVLKQLSDKVTEAYASRPT